MDDTDVVNWETDYQVIKPSENCVLMDNACIGYAYRLNKGSCEWFLYASVEF